MGLQDLPENLLQPGLPSPWGHGSCQEWACHGSQHSSGIPLLWHGLLHGLQVGLCVGSFSPSSPFTDLGVSTAVPLPCSPSCLWLTLLLCSTFPSFLRDIVPEVLPQLVMGLALACSRSVPRANCFSSIRCRGSF